MTLDHKAYIPQSKKKRSDLKLSSNNVLVQEEHFELLTAKEITEAILDSAGISVEELWHFVKSIGVKWYEPGEEIVLPWTKSG
jgi:transposase